MFAEIYHYVFFARCTSQSTIQKK